MVGNPPQTLSPDLRGDVPPSQQDRAAAAGDSRVPEVPSTGGHANPEKQCGHDPLLAVPCVNSEGHKKGEMPRGGTPGAALSVSGQQRPCVRKVSPHVPLASEHSKANASKAVKPQVQPVIGLPPGFHCTPLFKPGQPVAFLPAANFSSSLCKITLPPAVGHIAALREATAGQFHADPPSQSTSSGATPQLHAYGYHFSIGRPIVPDTKPQPVAVKFKGTSTAASKVSKVGADYSSSVGVLATASFPLKQPALSSTPLVPLAAPSAATVPTVTTVTLASRPPVLSEKGLRGTDVTSSLVYARLEAPSCARDPSTTCPAEARDVPLDLSSKSKRQNTTKDPVRTAKAQERQCAEGSPNEPGGQKRTQTTAVFGPASPYAVYPEAMRNGVPAKQPSRLPNHQVLEPSTSWGKLAPQGNITSIAGTYVGVASPILASTLRSKDGKSATFVEDLQSIAKQESISIIDQGEQHGARGTKGPGVGKDTQLVGSRHSNSACAPANQVCSSRDVFKPALSSSGNSQLPSKAAGGKGVVFHASPAEGAARHPPGRAHHQRASKQHKALQGSVPSQLGGSCHGSLTEGSRPDKKWDQTKCPLSNLESIVKDKALETMALSWDGGAGAERTGGLSQVDSLRAGRQDVLHQQAGAAEFPPFRSVKWTGGRSDKAPNGGSVIDGDIVQGGETEATKPPVTEDNTPVDIAKRGPASNQEHDRAGTKRMKPSNESLSPCVKLEGIALSILKGQGAVVAEGDKKTVRGKGKDRANSEKRISANKSSLMPAEPWTNVEKDVCKVKQAQHTKKSRKSWAAGLQRHHTEAPPPSPRQDREQDEVIREVGGQANSKTGNVNRLILTPPRVESPRPNGPPSPRRESEERDSPQLRRGRRRGDQAPRTDWTPAAPLLPTPVPPFRRPRGRPRSNPLPSQTEQTAASPAPSTEEDSPSAKKRRRRRNRKYQNGEYIVEKVQAGDVDGEGELKSVTTRKSSRVGAEPLRSSSAEPVLRRALLTRSGSTRLLQGHVAPEPVDKPSGKRKFKSKHLCDVEEDDKKQKPKRGSSGKRSAGSEADSPPAKKSTSPFAPPGGPASPVASRKGCVRKGGVPESPSGRPIPPEVRRLIVNKNAGETLLQRAARLGYQEVVLYCLEKDVGEVNRRDNAGYTALHEACAHGWTHIVQLLLEHGADVNCSAQDGTRPIHDAVASDSLPVVWMLLNHGADPTLATYSGQTVVKLAQSTSMKTFLTDYFADLEARSEEESSLPWNFYSSSVFETEQEPCWEFLLALPEEAEEEHSTETTSERDCFLFEFSEEPLLPCYNIQVSLSQGVSNWFLLSDVLKRLKMSARIFRARYPHFEVASMPRVELCRQVAVSQVTPAGGQLLSDWEQEEDKEGPVELVRCVPELQGLLGSSVQLLEDDVSDTADPCAR